MNEILIPISLGELLDKITILEIKSKKIEVKEKLVNVNHELKVLNDIWIKSVTEDGAIIILRNKLKSINEELWDIEDKIRDEERRKCFEQEFIRLARAVYVTNDQRAEVKKEINVYLKSEIIEEKSYQDYS